MDTSQGDNSFPTDDHQDNKANKDSLRLTVKRTNNNIDNNNPQQKHQIWNGQ